jgi:hypothetical protein
MPKTICVSCNDATRFEITGYDLDKVELKIVSDKGELELTFTVDSLLDFIDRLRFAAESVISEL